MDKKVILKLLGILLGSFLIMMIAIFFLYPYINSDKYEKLVNEHENKLEQNDSSSERNSASEENENLPSSEGNPFAVQAAGTVSEFDSTVTTSEIRLGNEQIELYQIIDSLYTYIENLEFQVDSLDALVPKANEAALTPDEFNNRVKGLLNLEENDLAPILANFSRSQLKRLYLGGGTIQREKILRALKAEEAAALMKELME